MGSSETRLNGLTFYKKSIQIHMTSADIVPVGDSLYERGILSIVSSRRVRVGGAREIIFCQRGCGSPMPINFQ